jgi:hypothetical protein
MKTRYTFLLMLIFVFAGYAQTGISTDHLSGSLNSGINAENQSFSVGRIYPNPVKDIVSVELHSSETGSAQVILINILGTEVKKWDPFLLQPGDQKLKLDLSFLKTGVYFLRISNTDKVITQVLKKN